MPEKMSKGPLLYIHQPFARTPAMNMQDTYTIRQEAVILEEEISKEEGESPKKVSLAKKEVIQEKASKEVNKLENPPSTVQMKSPTSSTPLQDKKTTSFNRVKPFKEMNIEERLNYLHNYPRVLPPARCVFATEEKNYQGYLTEYDGQECTIRFQDQSTKTLPVTALKNIIMIGIKN
ncbi:CotO family spore coat protein [Neobacillus drentensis]|uniref:CotO family spore coat protein n=1 Tax=Neobacillus drentensis TaxID=220684 RepID=UPI002FFF73B0